MRHASEGWHPVCFYLLEIKWDSCFRRNGDHMEIIENGYKPEKVPASAVTT
ncbi:MAG: hypothetical protein PHY92_09885 [Alphaproteobacteria bacterium]|nr:hypothetical protein [Alphaproteobacteria bacterium]